MKITNVSGCIGGESFLIKNGESALLLDTGYAFSAPVALENINNALNGKTLKYILLTHSHYDHVMGSIIIKKAFPSVQIIAHPRVKKIFEKESAGKEMLRLEKNACQNIGLDEVAIDIADLKVDRCVVEGDILDFGDEKIEILETPGHTRCSISFYFQKNKILAASESSGVRRDRKNVMPSFIVSYEMSMNSIKKMQKYDINALIVPHSGLITDENIHEFFVNSLKSASDLKDSVITEHLKGTSINDIVDICVKKHYKGEYSKSFPLEAFRINNKVMIEKLLEEYHSLAK